MTDSALVAECFRCGSQVMLDASAHQFACQCGSRWLYKSCRKCHGAAVVTPDCSSSWTCPHCSKSNDFRAPWALLGQIDPDDLELVAEGRTAETNFRGAIAPLGDVIARQAASSDLAALVPALGAIAIGLGASRPDQIQPMVASALDFASRRDLDSDDLPYAGNGAFPDAASVVELFSRLLGGGWEPPAQAAGHLVMNRGERVLATSEHERWIYSGAPLQLRGGGFFAFGSPLFVATALLTRLAIRGAANAAARREAAEQWRFVGRGRLSLTSQRLFLEESKVTAIDLHDILAAHVDDHYLHLVPKDGVPMSLRLPGSAMLIFSLYNHLASGATVPGEVEPAPSPAGALLSPDEQQWWDGHKWVRLSDALPPGAVRSPDGAHWHDGQRWRPLA